MTAYEQVLQARAPRPYSTRTLIAGIVSDFQECRGDRVHQDDSAIIGGIGWLDQRPVTVIATTKGETLPERLATHGGCPEPWGYRKALRLMRQAEKFHRPIITLIDTPGAYPGKEAEANGQAAAIADLLLAVSTLQTPLVAVIVGEGGSGGALALACGDEVWMAAQSMYAILSPEGFASILFKDVTKAEAAAALMGLTPKELLANQVVERVLPEAGRQFPTMLKTALIPTIARLAAMPTATLLAQRQARFRRY
ncbi:carboxyl transferase domain-containing protein [Lacticaseibacillus baoqingensis]|uniref:acetyl-CoA carboxytransferase n=1 Tax=Lacticaseibacillus baoqingensis TaxID=2486013 RepID=A0ABW4E740_9LACO|nr:carboxyl transferase domain-containing protein [Lacticaseibacillus baoqingensis]